MDLVQLQDFPLGFVIVSSRVYPPFEVPDFTKMAGVPFPETILAPELFDLNDHV